MSIIMRYSAPELYKILKRIVKAKAVFICTMTDDACAVYNVDGDRHCGSEWCADKLIKELDEQIKGGSDGDIKQDTTGA